MSVGAGQSDAVAIAFRITGAVQGVGYRPFVHRLAIRHGVDGYVGNRGDGVFGVARGPVGAVEAFAAALRAERPAAAAVDAIEIERTGPGGPAAGRGFTVVSSDAGGEPRLSIGPDLATCAACLAELRDPGDRRHGYPFLNCTACGPRYTVVTGAPYDRERTTLAAFAMCADCAAEYADPADRRFHAEPTACPRCGPQLAWTLADGRVLAERGAALDMAVELLVAGRIVAVLGVGGFHLMVRADLPEAVLELRRRKDRGAKPFAVLFADLEQVRGVVDVDPVAAGVLTSPAAPIVLLPRTRAHPIAAAAAPGAPELGAMLACTPLHHLLFDALAARGVAAPLIATSGNQRDEPIAIDPDDGRARLAGLADGFLVHDRRIVRPVDDSIVAVVRGEPMVLRRARGYAPLAFDWHALPATGVDLATGPHTKNTVALRVGRRVILSPHVGDLTTVAARAHHTATLADLQTLAAARAARVVCDAHPDYASTLAAEALDPAPLRVGHHAAHALALALDRRIDTPFLAACWDGTGHGDDGTVWGGEFLAVDVGRGAMPRRVARLAPFALPGGERAVAEPWRIAAGLLPELGDPALADAARARLAARCGIDAAQLRRVGGVARLGPRTSSVGRLFDAVGALVRGVAEVRYEAEAARALTALAWQAGEGVEPVDPIDAASRGTAAPLAERDGLLEIDSVGLFAATVADLVAGRDDAAVALRFHARLVAALAAVAARVGLPAVGLTGGCFQNRLLLEAAIARLERDGRTVHWPRAVPPNDGGIAAGQLVAAAGAAPRRPPSPS